MTSKNLFFKLMKKDLGSRLWAVALIGLGCFFSYPVVTAMSARAMEDYATPAIGLERYSANMISLFSFYNGWTAFFMTVAAVVCGISSFSYLNSKMKVDFYHSLPVRREMLFGANYVNGILIMAVPFVIAEAAAAVIAVGYGVDGSILWPVLLRGCGLHLVYFILMYTLVVIAVMLTGNIVVAFLGSVVLNSVVPMTTTLISGCFMTFFETGMWETWNRFNEIGMRFSPVAEYIIRVSEDRSGDLSVWAVMAALLASAVMAVIACLLYRARPSESAGKAMAFEVSKPIIRIILVMLSALYAGVLFWQVLESTGWAVFGVLCGGIICHCIMEVIYNFDFKKLFGHPVQLAGCLLVSLAVLLTFRYDLMGHDTYLPDAGKVDYAAVELVNADSWVDYGTAEQRPDGSWRWMDANGDVSYVLSHMQYQDINHVLEIAEEGIRQTQEQKREEKPAAVSEETVWVDTDGPTSTFVAYKESAAAEAAQDIYSRVEICYTLKSGRKVYRTYYMNLDRELPVFEKLYGSEAYQRTTFPLTDMQAEDVAEIRYRAGADRDEVRLKQLTDEEKKMILETYQKEFSAMSIEQQKYEAPIGLIRFANEQEAQALEWQAKLEANGYTGYPDYRYQSRYSFDGRNFYPVYKSFTETLSLLYAQGIPEGSYYDSVEISEIVIQRYLEDTWQWEEARIRNSEQIDQLKKLMTWPGMSYYNSFYRSEPVDVTVQVTVPGGEESYSAQIPLGQMPDFVEAQMELAK